MGMSKKCKKSKALCNKINQPITSNISEVGPTIRRVAITLSSGMYSTTMIGSLLADEGFSNDDISTIIDAAFFLQEEMYNSLKNLAGISFN